MYAVGNVARLSAEWRSGGVLVDPDAVTIRWRLPDGTLSDPVPAVHDTTGHDHYDLTVTQRGLWTWEFTGTGDFGGSQGGSLSAVPSLLEDPGPGAVCTANAVATAMRVAELTDAQVDQAESLIAQLVDCLELRLNRLLYPRTVTETHPGLGYGQSLVPYKGPVRSITSVTVDGVAETDTARIRLPSAHRWTPHVPIVLVYVAGDDPRPAVTGAIADVVARTMSAPAQAAIGVLKSYSVEGTSITYGDVADGGTGASGRLKVGDVRALGRLHRPVFLT